MFREASTQSLTHFTCQTAREGKGLCLFAFTGPMTMPHQCPRRIINEKTRLKSGRVKSSKDRYMQFLHRSNAELCVQMARTAKSVEIRQQWEELAKCWQAKADAEERHAESVDVVAAPQATTGPSFRRAALEDQNSAKPEPKSDPV